MNQECRHGRARRLCVWCVLQSLAFPVEHFVWEKAPGLRAITVLLGL